MTLALALVLGAAACGEAQGPDGGVTAEGGTSPVVWNDPDSVEVLASGEVKGVLWRAFALTGPSTDPESMGSTVVTLCIESESERFQPAPVCPGGIAPLTAFESDSDETLRSPKVVLTDELKFVVGMVNPGVARVVVEMGSGTPVEAEIVGEHGIHYVAALLPDASPSEVVAYAGTGAELDRRDFSATGSDDETYESPPVYYQYNVEEPPPCVEPDPDPALCGTGDPGG